MSSWTRTITFCGDEAVHDKFLNEVCALAEVAGVHMIIGWKLVPWSAYVLLKMSVETALSGIARGAPGLTVFRGLESALQDAEEEL